MPNNNSISPLDAEFQSRLRTHARWLTRTSLNCMFAGEESAGQKEMVLKTAITIAARKLDETGSPAFIVKSAMTREAKNSCDMHATIVGMLSEYDWAVTEGYLVELEGSSPDRKIVQPTRKLIEAIDYYRQNSLERLGFEVVIDEPSGELKICPTATRKYVM